jgi:cytochrome c1
MQSCVTGRRRGVEPVFYSQDGEEIDWPEAKRLLTTDRTIAEDGDVVTTFLVAGHNCWECGCHKALFESRAGDDVYRYHTFDEAIAGHKKLVILMRIL